MVRERGIYLINIPEKTKISASNTSVPYTIDECPLAYTAQLLAALFHSAMAQ